MSYFTYQDKKVFYKISGNGKPVVFLHGNATSSRMFLPILSMYKKQYQCIRLDFIGHGKSTHVDCFPKDLWYQEALQTIALIEHLGYQKVNFIGSSGGAYVALNIALLKAELVDKIIVDSFDGRTLDSKFSERLLQERKEASKKIVAKLFYRWCLSRDWKQVVKNDTESLLALANTNTVFFRSLSTITKPVLMLASKEDETCRKDIVNEYLALQKEMRDCQVYIFDTGKHPAILSNASEAYTCISSFINA